MGPWVEGEHEGMEGIWVAGLVQAQSSLRLPLSRVQDLREMQANIPER